MSRIVTAQNTSVDLHELTVTLTVRSVEEHLTLDSINRSLAFAAEHLKDLRMEKGSV